MQIKGSKVILIPISLEDKDQFFDLATKSFSSQFWYDDKEKRSREVFFKDWTDPYFDSENKEKGQCFWIVIDNKKIGSVIYNCIDAKNRKVELDIIIGDEEYLGKGYGSDALRALIKYLFENFDLNKIWIEARTSNSRAIKAYEKVGFKKEGCLREENYFMGKYVDCVRFGVLREK